MTKSILRTAYDAEVAKGVTPGYWEMSYQTSLLFRMDGQDFCGLPVNLVDAPQGEWWLYPADENDPVWQQHVQATST
jgi:hypothetical protein